MDRRLARLRERVEVVRVRLTLPEEQLLQRTREHPARRAPGGRGGEQGQGDAGKVRVLQNEAQETGVYAAPVGCDYDVKDDTPAGQECRSRELKGFYIRGFSVEEFPVNGIQTRWVDGFEFVSNASVNNLNNGIYPTLSANGLVRNNESYGSLDTAMWIAGSVNVRVIGNELWGSVIGFEITVSDEVLVKQNEIYDNTVGVGLFHPNGWTSLRDRLASFFRYGQ